MGLAKQPITQHRSAVPTPLTPATAHRVFAPHPLVRHPTVQTMLAAWRPHGLSAAQQGEQPLLLDCGPDRTGYDPQHAVRLLGYYTPSRSSQPESDRRGLVIALHGWAGGSHSPYNLIVGDALLQAGYDLFRLNLRDHGPSLGLNRGFFNATLIEEVVTAIARIAQINGDRPLYLVGPSLGGNFALRAAYHLGLTGQAPTLRRIVAISPVLRPDRSCAALDRHPLYHVYFRRQWLEALTKKQQLFPTLYQFDALTDIRSLWDMTEWLIDHYNPHGFADAQDYFHRYAVTTAQLRALSVPATLITAADDELIPVTDFYSLPTLPMVDLQTYPHGGHVGFVDIWPVRHRLPEMVLEALAS